MNVPEYRPELGLFNRLQGYEQRRLANEGQAIQNELAPGKLELDQMKHALNMQRYSPEQLEAMRRYREAAANNLNNNWRHLSVPGKLQMEEYNVRLGNLPTGAPRNGMPTSMQNGPAPYPGMPNAINQMPMTISPEEAAQIPGAKQMPLTPEQERAKGQYANYINKQVTDPEDRSRAKAGVNLEITVSRLKDHFKNFIDPYSGYTGALNKKIDEVMSRAFKQTTPELTAYRRFNTARHVAADQLRGYFKGSITNPAIKRLEELLVNDNLWERSPEEARAELEEAINLVELELPTYQNTHQGPEGYMPGASTGIPHKKPLTKVHTGDEIKNMMKMNPELTKEEAIEALDRFSPRRGG